MDREPLILGPFKLRVYIEYLRNELIEIAQKMGLNHQLTIQASEELDFFINEYERINR
ncbi:Spo0E family sporulation regulatory protein-aspartic acid phosphatase [Niallia sp. Krafla_26]|uniref:Spo0E family sporulation regulatory protein-aspartic acid phosphatase n=1 Tax=Niallia sp. Krafla_26 TaxID=3064703 RepID=UPI003D17581E